MYHEVGVAYVVFDHTPSEDDHASVGRPHCQTVDPPNVCTNKEHTHSPPLELWWNPFYKDIPQIEDSSVGRTVSFADLKRTPEMRIPHY